MLEQSKKLFRSHFGKVLTVAAMAPGRVNLIDEHTDYNSGYVLPVAVKESSYLTARLHEHSGVHIYAADLNASGTLDEQGGPLTGHFEVIPTDGASCWLLL